MLKKQTRRGLTLLELMIVLIILVGLMAIVGPRLLGTQKKADVRTAQAQIGNLVSALKQYAVDMKTYPTTEEGLALLIGPPEDEALAKSWDGPYLEGGKLLKTHGEAITNTNLEKQAVPTHRIPPTRNRLRMTSHAFSRWVPIDNRVRAMTSAIRERI